MKRFFIHHRCFFITLAAIAILLLMARLALPYVLLHYATHRINQIPDYQVKIADVDVHLYRGSYTIKDIQLCRVNKKIPVPFFAAKSVDLSVEWRALFHGSLVAQISIHSPTLNFVTDPKGDNDQLTIDSKWQSIVKSLFPLNFNRITVNQGNLHYRSFTSSPPFDLYLKNIDVEVNNLRKVTQRQDRYTSTAILTANTLDGAPVEAKAQFDPFAKQPTFKLAAEIKKMQISKANNFLLYAAGINVYEGWFSVYTELAAEKGRIKGYIKPFIKDLEIINPKKEMGALEAVYRGVVSAIAKLLENPQQETIATRIEIEGDIESPEKSTWSMIVNLIKHAFFKALQPQLEHKVEFKKLES